MKLILRQDTTLFFMHWSVLWFLAFCNVLFHTNVGLDNNSISIYIAIQYFSITVIWFLNISNISVYITSVSHTLIYHSLTLLNKHEHCTFQGQNAARVFYMNVSLKETDCLQKSFDGVFILSGKVAFTSTALLCLQPLPGKPLFLPLRKRLLLAENEFAFSIISPSPATCLFLLLLTLFFCFLQQLWALFIFFILAEAHLFQFIRMISLCYSFIVKNY